MTAVYVIFAILFFGVLIGIHEFGHFTAAKLCKVRVEEFSIGMGPLLWKKQKGETQYSLRAIPLGGFCAMTGEDGESEDPRAFVNQSVWKRLIILVAGSFNNFLLGFIIVALLYAGAQGFIAPKIGAFMEGCPYESAEGLQVGDRFVKINGHRIYLYGDVSEYLTDADNTYDLVLERGGKRVELRDYHMERISYPGYESKMFGFTFGYDEGNFANHLRYTWNTCMEFCHWVWSGLSQLVTGKVGLKDMSGPVGIVGMMAETGGNAETTADGIYNVLYLGAFIAVNLAVMNMLPIPALDGGRVFLLLITALIEAVIRKKLNPKYEAYIHAAGMVLLLGLMAVVMLNDIIRIFTR